MKGVFGIVVLSLLLIAFIIPIIVKRSGFKYKISTLFEDIRQSSSASLLYNSFYLLRRILIAATLILLGDYPVFQVCVFLLTFLLNLVFIALIKPFNMSKMNYQDSYNELFILLIALQLPMLTDYYYSPFFKDMIGWSIIALTLLCSLTNLFQMLYLQFQELIHLYKFLR